MSTRCTGTAPGGPWPRSGPRPGSRHRSWRPARATSGSSDPPASAARPASAPGTTTAAPGAARPGSPTRSTGPAPSPPGTSGRSRSAREAARWSTTTGRIWGRDAAAESALANTQLDDVLAVSARSVWVSGVTPANAADGRLVLVRWNGRCWKRFVAPWAVQQPERFAADGAGGIWIPVVTGGDSPATWILHLSRTGVLDADQDRRRAGDRSRRRRPRADPRDHDAVGHRRAADHAGR